MRAVAETKPAIGVKIQVSGYFDAPMILEDARTLSDG
jgi:hypothetical protein